MPKSTDPASGGLTPASTTTEETQTASQPGRRIGARKSQFLVAARRAEGLLPMGAIGGLLGTGGLMPLQSNVVEQTLRNSPDIEIVDVIKPKTMIGALADGMGDMPSVMVARMADEKAVVLQQQGQGRLIVERDQNLRLHAPDAAMPQMVSGFMTGTGAAMPVTVVVLGAGNRPVPDAEVYLFGSLLPSRAVTDSQGRVSLTLYGETPRSISALYVKPRADYWSFYQRNPDIDSATPNVVGLRALSDWPSMASFPQQQTLTWGQRAMRLDQLDPKFRGQGIKIAVIDSGAATTHEDLSKIRFGIDILNKKDSPQTWTEDMIAHGSHCAGVIAGSDSPHGVRGFAPDAEMHVCKLFPGGQVSQLIDALEYCIENQVDVVNLSLGGAQPSEALEQQLLRARRAGIACIVAAGNSGDEVQYPASSPHVLAVAAIGKIDEFPQDSYHAETVSGNIDANGFFSARFSCHGPQIAVCAPGVAITSSVPTNNFAVWDGTSMAAPHVTGLAALVLAHHPDFRMRFSMRNADRVAHLFQLIKQSTRAINVGDTNRTGVGMPDVLIALGLQPPAQPMMPRTTQQMPQAGATLGSMLGGGVGGAGGAIGGIMGGGMGGLAGNQRPGIEAFSMSPFASGMQQRSGLDQMMPQSWNPQFNPMGGFDGGYGNALPPWLLNLGAGRPMW